MSTVTGKLGVAHWNEVRILTLRNNVESMFSPSSRALSRMGVIVVRFTSSRSVSIMLVGGKRVLRADGLPRDA
jgi:hypothetical protein